MFLLELFFKKKDYKILLAKIDLNNNLIETSFKSLLALHIINCIA